MRKGIRLTEEIIAPFIEIHRSKNWTLDLKHDCLFSEKVSEIPLTPMRATPISSRRLSQTHDTIGEICLSVQ
jgi:hypothetical protein